MHFQCAAMLSSAFPPLISALPCCSVASKTYAIHFRCCAMRIRTIPSPSQHKAALRVSAAASRYTFLRYTLPLLHVTNHRIALAFLCAATLYFAIPLPCPPAQCPAAALLNNAPLLFATPLLRLSMLYPAVAFPGASRRLISMPSHRPVRWASQPTFSSGKKFASCIMYPNRSSVPPRLLPSSSSIL